MKATGFREYTLDKSTIEKLTGGVRRDVYSVAIFLRCPRLTKFVGMYENIRVRR